MPDQLPESRNTFPSMARSPGLGIKGTTDMADKTSTIAGTYSPSGEPLLQATLYLPCSMDPIEVTLLVSTGANQTIIAAQDWHRSDLDIEEWRWRQKAMRQAGKSVSDDTHVTLVMSDTEELRHHHGISAILANPGQTTHSVAGLDLLADSVLHMNPSEGVLTIEVPDRGLHYDPLPPIPGTTS